MFILDTNVISEPERPRPDPRVMAWSRRLGPGQAFTAAPVVSELLFGALKHDHPVRSADLVASIERVLTGMLSGRVLPFDDRAARVYARLKLATPGRNCPAFDLLIASITLANDMTLVTRNTPDFADLGVPLLNPWEA